MKLFPVSKLDEMEKTIIIKSVSRAWICLEIGLLVFAFVYSVAMQRFDLLSAVPLVLALMSLVVFFICKAVYTKEMTEAEGDEDEE